MTEWTLFQKTQGPLRADLLPFVTWLNWCKVPHNPDQTRWPVWNIFQQNCGHCYGRPEYLWDSIPAHEWDSSQAPVQKRSLPPHNFPDLLRHILKVKLLLFPGCRFAKASHLKHPWHPEIFLQPARSLRARNKDAFLQVVSLWRSTISVQHDQFDLSGLIHLPSSEMIRSEMLWLPGSGNRSIFH